MVCQFNKECSTCVLFLFSLWNTDAVVSLMFNVGRHRRIFESHPSFFSYGTGKITSYDRKSGSGINFFSQFPVNNPLLELSLLDYFFILFFKFSLKILYMFRIYFDNIYLFQHPTTVLRSTKQSLSLLQDL